MSEETREPDAGPEEVQAEGETVAEATGSAPESSAEETAPTGGEEASPEEKSPDAEAEAEEESPDAGGLDSASPEAGADAEAEGDGASPEDVGAASAEDAGITEAAEEAQGDDSEPAEDVLGEEAVEPESSPQGDEGPQLPMFEPSSEPHVGPERRGGVRKGSKLNKLLGAQVDLMDGEGEKLAYLYLVDLSEGGIRVNVDQHFPEETVFRMKLPLDSFGPELAKKQVVELPVQVVWQKRLIGGMTVAGLKFVDIPPDTHQVVKDIMERFTAEGRRKRFRLNRVLGVGIGLDENTRWLYPLALDLSVEGMRLRTEEDLTVGDELSLRIFLQFDLPVVNVTAKVVWKEQVNPGRFQLGLEFQQVDDATARPIQEYIDRCLAEETGKAEV
ncbi:MAG: PilZ domain-containing protein [Candidatus Eremiobacterota bacterium]